MEKKLNAILERGKKWVLERDKLIFARDQGTYADAQKDLDWLLTQKSVAEDIKMWEEHLKGKTKSKIKI